VRNILQNERIMESLLMQSKEQKQKEELIDIFSKSKLGSEECKGSKEEIETHLKLIELFSLTNINHKYEIHASQPLIALQDLQNSLECELKIHAAPIESYFDINFKFRFVYLKFLLNSYHANISNIDSPFHDALLHIFNHVIIKDLKEFPKFLPSLSRKINHQTYSLSNSMVDTATVIPVYVEGILNVK
jgi:hypothetical protein